MAKFLPVAVAQMVGRLNNIKENMTTACSLCKKAARKGAKLILFPEGSINGNAFAIEHQDFLPTDPLEFSIFQDIADSCDITVCIGFTTPLADKLNNAFAIIRPEKEILFQYKCARTGQEPEFLAPYNDATRAVFEVNGVRIVIVICCEYGLPNIEKMIGSAAPDLLLHPSAGCLREDQVASGGNHEQKTEAFKKECLSVIKSAAAEVKRRGIPKICSNPVGFDGERFWPGNSFAIDKNGEIVLWMKGENSPDRMKNKVEFKNIPI